jgi:Tfp pilus assembly protein PilF
MQRLVGIALISMLTACVSLDNTPTASPRKITAEMLLESSPLAEFGTADQLPDVEMLAITPEMKAFLDQHVNLKDGQNERLAQLVIAVMGEDRFQLAYDDSTRTAAETFDSRRGNCLSFTNMFIAMAREVNLDAYYQEVDIPPDWSMSGQTYLLSQHVNVIVEIRNALSRVVDFNIYDFHSLNESREISDQRARAHYFNNIGVERMLDDEAGLAYANLQQSLFEDRDFVPAWINMGILHRREGYPYFAEAAYLQALHLDRGNLLAMSNLANLYQELGKEDLHQQYLYWVQSHRNQNPYYRYQMANMAFSEGDYTAAIDHLKAAIRKNKDDDRFYYLLSLSYLMSGDREAAERWMEQAEKTARESAERQKYHHKLDLLREQNIEFN